MTFDLEIVIFLNPSNEKEKKNTVNHLDHFAVYGPSDSVKLKVFLAVIKI